MTVRQVSKAHVLRRARTYGRIVASGRGVLPDLALLCVKAAAAGSIQPLDAEQIYMNYIQPLINNGFVLTPASARAQPSKLRQIILVGHHLGQAGVAAIEKAVREHAAIVLACERDRVRRPVHDLYGYMVWAARNLLREFRARHDLRRYKYLKKSLKK